LRILRFAWRSSICFIVSDYFACFVFRTRFELKRISEDKARKIIRDNKANAAAPSKTQDTQKGGVRLLSNPQKNAINN
jgi:hypothetical protein